MKNNKRGNSRLDFKMKRIVKSKRSQGVMGMPFSVMFSIILIVFFIVAAIIAIKIFWNPNGCGASDNMAEALFKQELQEAVNDAWYSDRADSLFKINLPGKITSVCFMNPETGKKGEYSDLYEEFERFSYSGENNVYLSPARKACEDFRSMKIEHLNISEITKNNNPYCVEVEKGIRIEKGFYDNLVKVA